MAVCQPEPLNCGNESPVYSCQARFVNSTEPSGRAHTTIAGIVSISVCRCSDSLVWVADCVSAFIVFRRYAAMFLLSVAQYGLCCRAPRQTARGCVPNPPSRTRRPETVFMSYMHTITDG